MGASEINELAELWVKRKQEINFGTKIGNYIEKVLEINYFGFFSSMFFYTYLLIYEIQKTFELINKLFPLLLQNTISQKFLSIINYLCVEYYISNYYSNFSIRVLTLVINSFQFFMAFALLLDFIYFNHNQNQEKLGEIKKFYYNCIIFLFKNFSYSFNYINIFVLNYYNNLNFSATNLEIIFYVVNVFNTFAFTVSCLFFNYFFNDIDPLYNRYLNSVSKPSFNIMIYLKFIIMNLEIIVLGWIPSSILIFLLLFYKIFYFVFYYKNVYLINQKYNNFFVFRSFLIFTILISYLFYFFLHEIFFCCYDNNLILIYILIFSICFSTVITFKFLDSREKKIYEFQIETKDMSLVIGNHEELFIYHTVTKGVFTNIDMMKHKELCENYSNRISMNLKDECLCNDDKFLKGKITSEDISFLKNRTLALFSKIKGNTSIFHLFYFNYLLDFKVLDFTILTFLISNDLSSLPFYTRHLVVRMVKKFFKVYSSFGIDKNNEFQSNVNLKTLSLIIKYEFIFMEFLKKIKEVFQKSLDFWNLLSHKSLETERILEIGTAISSLSISISEFYGQMEKINKNQVKVLKIYCCFINSILNDHDYADVLKINIQEILQMRNNVNYKLTKNILEKEFGVLTISGRKESLFQILSYNKYAKNLIKQKGRKFNLKNQNLHYLLPYPLNVVHCYYLKKKLNFELLVPEKNLYCINELGNLIFLNMNICPCLDFDGTINFFNIFYLNTESLDENFMTALTDLDGRIFAISKEFRDEFDLNYSFSLQENIKLYDGAFTKPNEKNILQFANLDNFQNFFPDDEKKIYPVIWNLIPEVHKFFLNQNFDENETPTLADIQNIYSSINEPSTQKDLHNQTNSNSQICRDESSLLNKIKVDSSSNIMKYKSRYLTKENPDNFVRIAKKGTKLDIKIIKKTSLGGLFTYYSIQLKKLDPFAASQLVPEKEKILNYNSGSLFIGQSTNLSSVASAMGNNPKSGENKLKITNYLLNFQGNKYGDYSSIPNIVKIIFYYIGFIMIFFGFLAIISMVQVKTNVNYFTENFKILQYFFEIKEKYYYLILNIRSLTDIRIGFKREFYSDQLNHLNTSVFSDIQDFQNFIQNLYSLDLTNFPLLQNELSNQNINLSYINMNYSRISTNYSFTSALNIYLSKIIEVVNNQSFILEPSEYFNFQGKIIPPSPSANYVSIDFIFYNFFNTFMYKIREIAYLTNHDISSYMTSSLSSFYIFLIVQSLVLFLIIFFTYRIVNHLYTIHKFIIDLFTLPDEDFIRLQYSNHEIIKNKIVNFESDEKFLSIISKSIEYDIRSDFLKQQREQQKLKENKMVTPQFGHVEIVEEKESPPILKRLTNAIHKNAENGEIKINTNTLRKKELLNSKSFSESEVKKLNNFETNRESIVSLLQNDSAKFGHFKRKGTDKPHQIDGETTIFKTKQAENSISQSSKKKLFSRKISIYFKIYFLAITFFLSMTYIIVFQLSSYPDFSSAVSKLNNLLYVVTNSSESNYMQFNCLENIMTNNAIMVSNSNVNIFGFYAEMFYQSQQLFSNYIDGSNSYLNELRNRSDYQLSSKFCNYFYNYTNNYQILQPKISIKQCNDFLPEGIEIFLYQNKKKLMKLFDKFNTVSNENHTLKFLMDLSNDTYLSRNSLILNYYARGFYQDIINSTQEAFSTLVFDFNKSFYVIFIVFVLHIAVSVYSLIFHFFKIIYFYFEKMRIFISILPKKYTYNNEDLSKFLEEYY